MGMMTSMDIPDMLTIERHRPVNCER